MISLSVTPDDPEAKRYEREVKLLQSDISMGSDFISGKLLYNEQYTGIFADPEKQSGHYLALKFGMDAKKGSSDISSEYDIKVAIEDHDNGYVTVDDGWCVFRITDTTKPLHVVIDKKEESDKHVVEKIYKLNNLTLEPKAD